LKGAAGSFKFKLVAYFVLLSLLPLAAAYWGFTTVAARAETRAVDARLQAGLRATLAAYQQDLRGADREAATLARNRTFERALVGHDRAALDRIVGRSPNLAVVGDHGLQIGRPSPTAATRGVDVLLPGGSQAEVIASVPLDASLVRRLEGRSGLDRRDHVVLIEAGRVVAGPPGVRGAVQLRPGRTATVRIGRARWRGLIAGTLQEQPSATLGLVSAQSAIDAANWTVERRLLMGLIGALLLIGVAAYLEGRAIVHTIRRLVEAARAIARGDLRERVQAKGHDEFALLGRTFNQMASQLETRLEELAAERARLRNAMSHFGDVLASTHDLDQLRRAIVETAVEATRASGGVLLGENGELVQVGYPAKGRERVEVPLQAGTVSFGSLLLFADDFEDHDRMAAASLAAQAVIALDNARLHRIVERQARVDGLTGLANRRAGEDYLESELARVARFGGPLAVVVADLDDFKAVNDRFGHAAGDLVLREFAHALEEGIRDVDLACRWGGEEFVLVLPGTDLTGAAHLAERIRLDLESRVVLSAQGEAIPMRASFGVAAASHGVEPKDVLAAADAALYRAKRAGKNCVAAPREPAGRP
jgi:diguanylate cyclase (GGDEF)-like protein